MNTCLNYFNSLIKLISIFCLVIIAGGLLLIYFTKDTSAVAGINRTINFQGKLVNNPAKTNVSNTTYTVVFTLYDRGSGGTVLWQETQIVTTVDGIFRVALGSVNPIPANFNFNWDGLYLGMKVGTDSEMTPRIQMAAVPYAFNAEKVSGLTVQDSAGNASTSGTLRIPNAETINLGNNSLTFTTSTDTTLTLPASGTLSTLAGTEELTNKTIGSTGLVFSGATTDITTASNEDLTVTPNGSGDFIIDLTSTGEFYVKDAGNNFAQFLADGTITLGKSASNSTLNLGTGTGADTISIGSDNTVGDTLVIGNNNINSTFSLFGGDDWYIEATGGAKFNSILGAGLLDCDSATSKLLWNDATGTFSCGVDLGSNLQIVDFTDTTTEVATFTSVMDIWDGAYANITPGSTNSEILISINIRGTSDDGNDHNPVFTIRRAIDSNPTCSSTQVGGEFVGGFLTTTAQDWGATVTTSDAPSSTGNVRYTVCTTTTGLDDANTDEVRIVLTEIGTSSSGGGGGNVAVRETDSSPSVASVFYY